MRRYLRTVPAFGMAGGVLFAGLGLVFTLALLIVTAGVMVADDIGILLHDIAVDAALAGQSVVVSQETGTDMGFSGSAYQNPLPTVQSVVDTMVQADTANLTVLKLGTPVVTIDVNEEVSVTLQGSFTDSLLSDAFSSFLGSSKAAQFPIVVHGSGTNT